MGCNGLYMQRGGLTYDVCGVCGGKNTSCIGCDGVASPRPKKFDACQVVAPYTPCTCECIYCFAAHSAGVRG
jgi:hypothetical protein